MRGRAAKRAKTEAKVKRARKILIERGLEYLPETQPAWRTLDISARKFAASHFGCACWMCTNPRQFWKGKAKASLPFAEYRQLHFHKTDHMSEE